MLRFPLSGRASSALFLLLLAVIFLPGRPVFADISEPSDETVDDENLGKVEAETHRYVAIQSGYRFVTPIDFASSAAPYTRLKSGMGGALSIGSVGSDLKLLVDASILNEDDYNAGLYLDYSGRFRLNFLRQSLWHNLLTEQLPPGEPNVYESKDLAAPGTSYTRRSTVTRADSRFRVGNHPFHLNLGYWQLDREGTEQLRFSDQYFGDPQSRILSTARKIDSTTREGFVGLDGYFGFFGLSYGFRIRDFSNEARPDRYNFSSTGNGAITVGNQAHDVIPDSRVSSHTVKLYSDLSGGLVGSAAYTLTRRENRSNQGDARPSNLPADTLQLLSGDLSYTPFRELAFALKYRRQEIERESPMTIAYPFSSIPSGTLLVRPSTESIRDTLLLSGTYRPTRDASLQLEYRAELESRGNLADPLDPGNPAALHSDRRQIHTGKASFSWRPFNGARLNANYSYSACDNPAYAASYSGRHSGQIFLTYASSGKWGATASYLARFESGESRAAEQVISQPLPRESRNNSANANFWFSPLDRLTLTASYSFLQSNTDQTILFTSLSAGSLTAGNYRSTAHIYGIDAVYTMVDTLDLSLGFQQIWSTSRFSVPEITFIDPTIGTTYTTSGITALTSLDSMENSISARADWRFSQHFGCALDYRFSQYDSDNPLFDGTVHTTILSLTGRW